MILNHGPLSGLEAAWITREVADALAGVHSLGLYHRRLSPETVIITPSGNIKIVGLLIEAALRPRSTDEVTAVKSPEQVDVTDLGRLLYAALVCRWPGGPAFGLPNAPMVGRRWMTPRQVRAGVSPALDNVCDQVLGDPPRHHVAAIATAGGLVTALTKILGTRGCHARSGATAASADPKCHRQSRCPGCDDARAARLFTPGPNHRSPAGHIDSQDSGGKRSTDHRANADPIQRAAHRNDNRGSSATSQVGESTCSRQAATPLDRSVVGAGGAVDRRGDHLRSDLESAHLDRTRTEGLDKSTERYDVGTLARTAEHAAALQMRGTSTRREMTKPRIPTRSSSLMTATPPLDGVRCNISVIRSWAT